MASAILRTGREMENGWVLLIGSRPRCISPIGKPFAPFDRRKAELSREVKSD